MRPLGGILPEILAGAPAAMVVMGLKPGIDCPLTKPFFVSTCYLSPKKAGACPAWTISRPPVFLIGYIRLRCSRDTAINRILVIFSLRMQPVKIVVDLLVQLLETHRRNSANSRVGLGEMHLVEIKRGCQKSSDDRLSVWRRCSEGIETCRRRGRFYCGAGFLHRHQAVCQCHRGRQRRSAIGHRETLFANPLRLHDPKYRPLCRPEKPG